MAIIRPDRIDIRPSPAAIIGPAFGLLLGLGCGLLIWFGMDSLPLWLLAILLIVALVGIPFAGIGLVYALIGAHVVIDRAKQSATWQQGFLGMGVGTVELVPFWKIDQIIVAEAGTGPDTVGRRVEEFAQWRITLLKKSGKRLEIGIVSAPRAMSREGFARARDLASALADLTGAPLTLPEGAPRGDRPADAPATARRDRSSRRERRVARRR